MTNRVIHFDIQADKPERAKEFYEKVFNWKLQKSMSAGENGMDMDWWSVTTGPDGTPGINGGMSIRPKKKNDQLYAYHCTIMVEDIGKTIKNIKESGGKIEDEKMEIKGVGWFVGAVDTEGNMFGVMQPTDWKPH